MFKMLLAGLVAAFSFGNAPQEQLFEEADGWRVFKTADSCVGYFSAPGSYYLTVFFPNSRDALTMILHAPNVPAVSAEREHVLVRMGRSQWGPVEASAYASKEGMPGVLLGVARARALDELGKADSITFTKRFQPPRTIPLRATAQGADMLRRCVG